MTPVVLPADHLTGGVWHHGWCVYFTPTDPDTSPMQWRPTREQAERLAARIEFRQHRDQQWADAVMAVCGA